MHHHILLHPYPLTPPNTPLYISNNIHYTTLSNPSLFSDPLNPISSTRPASNMAAAHGTVAHLLPQTYKRMVSAWLEEDCPSFDYGGFVVGEKMGEAKLLGKSPVGGVDYADVFCLRGFVFISFMVHCFDVGALRLCFLFSSGGEGGEQCY